MMSENADQHGCPRRPFGDKVRNPRLPKTVPIIGLGCSSFANNYVPSKGDLDVLVSCNQENAHLLPAEHGRVKEWIETLARAVNSGINLLDTAPWYGHGCSEVVIGMALRQNNFDRARLIINTKVGRYDSDRSRQFDFSHDMTIHSVKRSIKRMGCEYIDVLQLHDPEFSPSIDLLIEETIPAMLECKRLGLAKALGLTGYPLETHYEILQRASAEIPNDGEAIFDQTLTYGHFNLHDQDLFAKSMNEDEEESLVEYCRSKSIAVMAAAPLSMGLLTHNPPPFWHPASDALKEACKDAARTAEENGVDLPTLSTLFALSHESVGCTLIGMGCRRDLDCALAVMKRYESSTSTGEGIILDSDGALDGKKYRTRVESNLASILTESERKVFEIIMDDGNGPFAQVWKEGGHAWDGKEEARKFWSKVEGGREDAEIRMRARRS